MKLLEIKNNLVKLSFEVGENVVLGRFMVLMSEGRSYVAQFVNVTSEHGQNSAVARLLFTFTPEGVVDDYDGSVPNPDSELSLLSSEELLDLLPSETPIKVGTLAQEDYVFNLDISVFEHNLTVFAKRDKDKFNFIANSVRQLFQAKEKTVIFDNSNLFADYPRIKFTKDFKLPLNAEMIDYLFEYELADVDAATKAVIQDIFYSVQTYIKSLDCPFLPVDNFVEVVTKQYRETQMPELALLKNKLLAYRDANIFANTKEEFLDFIEQIKEKNCSIIDLADANEPLQNYLYGFIHAELEKFDKFVYLFVPLNDYNSTKKLLKRFINHNHVFTTMFVDTSYKYAQELKSQAENIILFAPSQDVHDFAEYSTLLGKLNQGECVVYGNLTHNIPFVVSVFDIDLPLTKEDVLGDKYRFVPVQENLQLVKTGSNVPFSLNVQSAEEAEKPEVAEAEKFEEQTSLMENLEEYEDGISNIEQEVKIENPVTVEVPQDDSDLADISILNNFQTLDTENTQKIENLLADDEELPKQESKMKTVEEPEVINFEDVPPQIIEEDVEPQKTEENIFGDENSEEIQESGEDIAEQNIELTEDDLDYIDENNVVAQEDLEKIEEEPVISEDEDENPQMVPVYPADENDETTANANFAQGDVVSHPRYGQGVVEKIIKYGNKTLCSISFDNVGRRLLDPSISEFEKVEQ